MSGSLRILIHLDFLGLGGHMLSTISLASALQRRGHEVLVAGELGPLRQKLEDSHLRFVRLPLGLDPIPSMPVFDPPNGESIASGLSELAVSWKANVVHAFHPYNLPAARRAALAADIPSFLTICGGRPQFSLPEGQSETIVFSEELRDAYVQAGIVAEDRIHVVENRLPIAELTRGPWNLEPDLEERMLPNSRRILMIGRLEEAKMSGTLHVVEAISRLREKVANVQLLLVGVGPGSRSVRARAAELGLSAESGGFVEYGRVYDAYRLIPHADVCAGVGRSIFEAMAIGRPCVIVGANGFAGVVSPEWIEQISYFNFSGRNATSPSTVQALTDAFEELLSRKQLSEELVAFGRDYAAKRLDVEVGAAKYEKTYMNALRQWEEGTIPRDRVQAIADYRRQLRKKRDAARRGMILRRAYHGITKLLHIR